MAKLTPKLRKRYYKYLRWRYGGRYFGSNFTHPLIRTDLPAVITSDDDAPIPEEFLQRLCQAYRGSDERYQTTGDIWQTLEANRAPYIDALRAGRTDRLRMFYNRLLKDDLLEGMGHAEALFVDEANNPYCKNYFQLRTVDALMSLGEAVGVHAPPNMVQMSLDELIEHMNPEIAPLARDIEAAIGFSLAMPPFGNPPVIDADLRLNPDSLRHAYTIYRLKRLGATEASRILEIGGGYGMAALLAHRAGLRNYMIVDIPYVASLQGAYLGAVLDDAQISLAGEADAWIADKIQIEAPDFLERVPDKSIDFVVNTDSLPEMPDDVARGYVDAILRICRGTFLSINQEARTTFGDLTQGAVRELMSERDIAPAHRFRHWMEQGYVEEVFDMRSNAGPVAATSGG